MGDEIPRVLLLGNPLLRKISDEVNEFNSSSQQNDFATLHNVLLRFREEHGFGRGIAAPQLGMLKRVVALNLNGQQTTMVNPQIIWSSPEEFSLWDDCMCFPDLLVRVKRKSSISLKFQNPDGSFATWEKLDPARSELLQHELDHLDGVLAIDRAIDKESVSYRVNVQATDPQSGN